MRIVLVHNFYRQPGGEDQVFAAEAELLRGHGHFVRTYTLHNDQVEEMGPVALAGRTLWNGGAYRQLRKVFREESADLVHFHNTFPLVSPAAYYAARAEGVPVVQTLHNYRLLCPNSLFFRDGAVCESCLGKSVPWPGVAHGCYRGSRMASGAVAALLAGHRLAATWRRMVDVYLALTEFARAKFVEGGLPSDRLVVKPNFVPDPGARAEHAGYALFVGRLSPEKGVSTLLRAWRRISGIRLKIVGDGPMRQGAEEFVRQHGLQTSVEILGHRPMEEVLRLMKGAQALIFPSEWYEGAPRVVMEAFACGVPVIAARRGALVEIVDHARTGLHFDPGDPDGLATQVALGLRDPDALEELGRAARREYESRYSPMRNYTLLIDAYHLARGRAGRAPAPGDA